jgi:hypothetical protein
VARGERVQERGRLARGARHLHGVLAERNAVLAFARPVQLHRALCEDARAERPVRRQQ